MGTAECGVSGEKTGNCVLRKKSNVCVLEVGGGPSVCGGLIFPEERPVCVLGEGFN